MSVLRILRGTVGSMVTFKSNHKHLAQWHELNRQSSPATPPPGRPLWFLPPVSLLVAVAETPSPGENNSLLNFSHHQILRAGFLLRLRAIETQTREDVLTTA